MTDRAVVRHLTALFDAHRDLVAELPEQELGRRLGERSNAVGSQYWCVIGGRESYALAITQGSWAGFTCSIGKPATRSTARLLTALDESAELVMQALLDFDWTTDRTSLVLDLLEHESQHQGQLIRYLYALGGRFPDSWRERWALEQPS